MTAVVPVPWHRDTSLKGDSGQEFSAGYPVAAPRFWYLPVLFKATHSTAMMRAVRQGMKQMAFTGVPDLVLSYWAYPDADAAGRLAQEWGVPSVAILGGSDLLIRAKQPSQRQLISGSLARHDRLYTIGDHLREAALELGARPESTFSLERGVNRKRFSPMGVKKRFAEDEVVFLWAGRMEPVKNLHMLLDAVAGLALKSHQSKFRVVLIGDGTDRNAVAQRVARDGLPVTITGNVEPLELADWYRRADVVVLTSLSEGMPNVLLESAASGTPFITTAVGGAEALADRLGGTTVSSNDPRMLAEAMTAHINVSRSLWCPPSVLPDATDAIGRFSRELATLLMAS